MDDLQGFADELSGRFSTLCPYVQNRRKRVTYWVESVLNGICSTTTAAEALHIS
jgi:ribosome modulation factor